MKVLKTIGYWFLSYTWGIIMTLIGTFAAIGLLIIGRKPHFYKGGVYFKIGKNWGGVELGPFFITDDSPTVSLVYHEWGHGIQNIIFGPLMPFLVCIPSAVRYWYREFKYWRKGKIPPTEYDSIWFEGWATAIGRKYYKKGDYEDDRN